MNTDRLMRNMMQSMGMQMPMMSPFFGDFDGPMQSPMQPMQQQSIMPHAFMSPMSMMMLDPFQSMQTISMANNGSNNGSFSYCSSSVTSYTTDEHGRPQVYQQSNEVKQGPGGLKEIKSAVRDSRTGHQELAIGHHLREKGHIKKKSRNVYTNEQEEADDFINIDESEAESFEQNWMRQARNASHSSSYNQLQYNNSRSSPSRNNRLALTSSAQEDRHHQNNSPSHHKQSTVSSLIDKVAMKTKKKKKTKEPKV